MAATDSTSSTRRCRRPISGSTRSWPSWGQVAYRALAAVLHTLRDRLTTEEAAHLGAQLPILVRGIYYDGWRPAAQPQLLRSREAFLEAIAERLSNIRPINPETAARAVFATLRRHVTEGETDEVMAMLPQPIRALWPDVEPPPPIGAKREERSQG